MPSIHRRKREQRPPTLGAKEVIGLGSNKIPTDRATKRIKLLAVMEANDATRAEKLKAIFNIDMATATPREINNADVAMCRWRRHPAYSIAWKEEQSTWDFRDYAKARQVLRNGMKQDSDPWLAMNSAVNTLSTTTKRIFHDEESEVTVKIEGMPEIGSPDDDG